MKAIFNVRTTANGKPPLDDVRVMEPRPSRTKQPPTTGNGRAESRPSQASDSQPLVIEGNLVAEQDSAFARMTILQVYPEDEGEYTCVVRSKLGKVTTSACLIIDVPEEKEALVSGQLSRPPGLLSTESTPRSTPRTTPSRSKSPSMPTERGAPSTWTPPAPTRSVNKRHRLKAAPPKFYAIPHNKVVEEGATVRFQCAIAGHPTPWVTWDTDGLILTPSRRLTIKEKDDLRIVEISEVSVEDAGLYRVTLENDVGRVEASARLDVIVTASIWWLGSGCGLHLTGRRRSLCWLIAVDVKKETEPGTACTISQPVSKKEPLQILKVEEMVETEELCQMDKLLEDQRKIIFEIQIKLDEKQKELEELRQSLDTQHSAVDRLEAEKQQLQQRLLETDEKLEKSVNHDETEHVWRELDERRRQVEQLSREKVALEVGLKLAAFLAALLRRPHLLASFPAANRSSLLQLLDQSRSLDASALAVPAALEDSLLDHIHKFLDVPQHFIHEVVDETGREEGAMVNVRSTANGKPPLDDVRVIELRTSRTKQPPQLRMEELSRDHHRPVTHSKVQTLPSITRSLRDRRCCDGDTVTFECGLAPTPVQPDVRWEKDGKPLVIEGDLVAEPNSAFARLTILQVYPEDEGEYTCVVRSKLGKVTTSACPIVDVTASIWWLGSSCGLRLSGRRRSLCWLIAVVVKKEAEPGTACTSAHAWLAAGGGTAIPAAGACGGTLALAVSVSTVVPLLS
ncbi:Hypothetical predicted protein [Cloeon dipterum]|uniref:Ig-like domain-containing protein n=1 Tax=Cloeon dipterum TaxID=197152 RepID=A0A8S1E236_9INSE|nr:Hypothetical predicted protein [Cloeon dipterum]